MQKKFVSLSEGAELYSMSTDLFRKIAEEGKALYKMERKILVNLQVFEEYLEIYRL